MDQLRVSGAVRPRTRFSAFNKAWNSVGVFLGVLCTVWIIGPVLLIGIFTARFLGLLHIQGYSSEKFRTKNGEGLLVIHRHPSMRETLIIPVLFLSQCIFHFSRVPLITPDKRNIYGQIIRRMPLRVISIFIDRGNFMGQGRALLKIRKALAEGRSVVLAPEGGRTWKGKEFKTITAKGEILIFRPEGAVDLSKPVIRRFQEGVRKVVAPNVAVLPIWVKSKGWRTTIKIGYPFGISKSVPACEIPELLEDSMLQLAAEE
ncbi:MAG: 1-acyl-sn-glycerol-3-phosphate acyltransferase [Candidatus Wildermuthbacteria bacterium]|nr:1-acyl-sn-glycerol-3-phosphate acyltransferase [Candidatus Wildermuthbacteria bacterium]